MKCTNTRAKIAVYTIVSGKRYDNYFKDNVSSAKHNFCKRPGSGGNKESYEYVVNLYNIV